MTHLLVFGGGVFFGVMLVAMLVRLGRRLRKSLQQRQRQELYTALGYRFYNLRFGIQLLQPKFDDYHQRDEWVTRMGETINNRKMKRESQCATWTS